MKARKDLNILVMASPLVVLSGSSEAVPRSLPPRAVIEAKFAAVNRHAVADIVNLYSPGARMTSSSFCAPRHGREDVRRT